MATENTYFDPDSNITYGSVDTPVQGYFGSAEDINLTAPHVFTRYEDEGAWEPGKQAQGQTQSESEEVEESASTEHQDEGNLEKTGSASGAGGAIPSWLKNLIGGAPSGKMPSIASLLGGAGSNPLQGVMGLMLLSKLLDSKSRTPTVGGYKGPGINMGLTATRQAYQPQQRAYGAPAMGQQFFSPVQYAAQGGIMAAKGRYLQGSTDGMADEIPSSIDGKQPARLSHGEFVVPADVVSHLGNGNSDAGADVLYKMMDRVRKARTGTTRQGKRINPAKFTPGGQAYSGGGVIALNQGGVPRFNGQNTSQVGPAVNTQTPEGTTTEQNLASWAGPYVMDYLSRGRALAQMPYQPYQGQLTAGTSPLQQQAFGALSGLGGAYPGQFDVASQFATQAGQRAGLAQYTPGQFTMGQVTAPELKDLQMQAPQNVVGAQTQQAQLGTTPLTQAAQTGYQPQLQTYQMAAQPQVTTQSFAQPGSAESYMSPYMQSVVSRQQQAAQREADIAAQTQKAQFAQSGAFGGGRQGIQQARAAEALARQKGDIQAQGLQSAYQQAQQQFNQEQQARLAAQQANLQAGLTTGQQNLAAQLGVQQLGTQTGLQTALANLQAQQQANLANQGLLGQYGLQQGQFGQQAAMQNAQLAQQAALANQQMGYNTGLQNLQARLATQQLGAGQNLQSQLANQQALMQAQQAAEQSRQFGAGYGMQGIGQQLAAAGQLGQLGQGQFGTQLSGIQALLGAGQTQYGQEQAGLTALQNEYNKQMMWPYQQLQFQQSLLSGLPIAAQGTTPNVSGYQNFKNILGDVFGLSKIGGNP